MFNKVTKELAFNGKLVDSADTMFKVLLKSKLTYGIHELRFIYLFVSQLIGDKNDFMDNISVWFRNQVSDDDRIQAILALGYAFWKYGMLKYNLPGCGNFNAAAADEIFGMSDFRQAIKEPERFRVLNKTFMKFIKENIKAAFLDYVCDIYDIIYSYVPAFLKMIGINDEDVSNIRPKYSISDNELKMLTDSLRLHISSDYLYEFMSYPRGILLSPFAEESYNKKKAGFPMYLI